MWWLDDAPFDEDHNFHWKSFRRRSLAENRSASNRGKRVSRLSPAEIEANKRLLEAGAHDDSIARSGSIAAESSRTRAAETAQRYERQIRKLRQAVQAKIDNLNGQLATAQQSVGDQARVREHARLQQDRLRQLLLEAEQRLADRGRQVEELHCELEDRENQAAQQTTDLQRRHDGESAYLRTTAADAERRAGKYEQEVKKLRDFALRLSASHHAQLTEARRQCNTELAAAKENLSALQSSRDQLRDELTEQRVRLEDSESKRAQQARQLALMTQQCQIAEQVVRQTQQAADARAQQDAEALRTLRAA